jgi:ech hydrogenase subunit F
VTLFPMIKLAMRNLLAPPATRRYPYKVRAPFAQSRGRIVIDFPACIFCGACAKHCPAGSITTDRAAKSWSIDRFSCVSCAACVRVCPKKCLAMAAERPSVALPSDEEAFVEAYAAEAAANA